MSGGAGAAGAAVAGGIAQSMTGGIFGLIGNKQKRDTALEIQKRTNQQELAGKGIDQAFTLTNKNIDFNNTVAKMKLNYKQTSGLQNQIYDQKSKLQEQNFGQTSKLQQQNYEQNSKLQTQQYTNQENFMDWKADKFASLGVSRIAAYTGTNAPAVPNTTRVVGMNRITTSVPGNPMAMTGRGDQALGGVGGNW